MVSKGAAKRIRLYDIFVNQPGHADLTVNSYFYCPLCRTRFVRDDCLGINPKLSLAHVIPKSQGGTWRTLCCARCNSGNGRQIEKDFLTQQMHSDWINGRGAIPIRLGDDNKIKGEMIRDPINQRIDIRILSPISNPAVAIHLEQMKAAKEGDQFKLSMPWFRNGWSKATVCQSAYLLMFRTFGYDFARCGTYDYILRQVRDPDSDHKDVLTAEISPEVAGELLEGTQAKVLFLSSPIRCILAIMRFKTPGLADAFKAVAMPGPGETQLGEFSTTGMRFTPVADNVEIEGRWGHSLTDEWTHWQQLAAAPSSLGD